MGDVYEIAEATIKDHAVKQSSPATPNHFYYIRCDCSACTFARALLAQKAVVEAAVAAYKARQSFWERDEEYREGGDLAEVALYEHMENEAISAYVCSMKEQTR